jgi:hypothetical protein
MSSSVKEKNLAIATVNPVKGLEYLSTVCASVQKSGALARALCALDQSKIGAKMAFTYSQQFKRGADLTGIILPTMIGWMAIDQSGNVLGVSTKWSGTELYNDDEFNEQLRRVLLAGLPGVTFAKLLDVAVRDNAKATALWMNLRGAINDGLDALQPE